ncbi:hypothetical protein ACNTMW_16160 [Planosporangium sp. 12N6]|uniref:hypothetical protein n=1 Tax=Planosporangium spinosum TaxID=3402278 RepID=UPI003CEAFAD4
MRDEYPHERVVGQVTHAVPPQRRPAGEHRPAAGVQAPGEQALPVVERAAERRVHRREHLVPAAGPQPTPQSGPRDTENDKLIAVDDALLRRQDGARQLRRQFT